MSTDRGERPATTGVLHKVLNNNVVIAIEPSGRERVLMGRGIGFQLKPDSGIDPAKIEKTFILDEAAASDHARRLLAEVPYTVIDAVTSAVDEAERMLGRDLGRRISLAVIDHVH
jgi:beta-glucoside operon transcriptional antiterminator